MPRKKPPLKERELITCLKVLRELGHNYDNYKEHSRLPALLRDAQRLLNIHEDAQPQIEDKPAFVTKEREVYDIGVRLAERKRCYSCKTVMHERHPSYRAFCLPCGELNLEKRHQQADLSKHNVVLTGGRSKIGFHTCLKLLRSGARVLMTTRFPKHAAERYAQEADFPLWKKRLSIYGLDLRSMPAIERFVKEVEEVLGTVDILINNAAQTIRRPPLYYQPLLRGEVSPFESPEAIELLSPWTRQQYEACAGMKLPVVDGLHLTEKSEQTSIKEAWLPLSSEKPGLMEAEVPEFWRSHSSFLTSVPFLESDWKASAADFPPEQLNRYNELADLRDHTSWEMQLEEVETFELFEVHMINALAPFVLMRDLRPLMLRSPHEHRFVINVTSIEGQFAVTKTPSKGPRHPHTNMTKAALNMLTLSGAHADAREGIYRSAVDPGWASIENALPVREHWFSLGVEPPITMEDAAARLCDPFFTPLLHSTPPIFGKLLKDYKVVPW